MIVKTLNELSVPELLDRHAYLAERKIDVELEMAEGPTQGPERWRLSHKLELVMKSKKEVLNELLTR